MGSEHTGGTVYGNHRPLRTCLEERRQAYALGISCQECVEVDGTRKRADHFARQIDAQAWHVLSCGGRFQRSSVVRMGMSLHQR
jgi:hypothetical protein